MGKLRQNPARAVAQMQTGKLTRAVQMKDVGSPIMRSPPKERAHLQALIKSDVRAVRQRGWPMVAKH